MKILIIGLLMGTVVNASELCQKWSEPVEVGQLNTTLVSEASGLVRSSLYPGRYYLLNDSNEEPGFYFYATSADFRTTEAHKVADFKDLDAEEMGIGPCLDKKSCLFVADIGDNREVRENISLVLVEEVQTFASPVQMLKQVTLRYPDRAHNAEGMVVRPNGDVVIMTKNFSVEDRRAGSAQIFVLRKEQIDSAQKDQVITLQAMGEIEIPYIAYEYGLWGQIITGATLSADGAKVLLSTYENVIELKLDLSRAPMSTRQMKEGVDYVLTPFRYLPQQEALTYLDGDRSFLITTESVEGSPAPVLKVTCEDQQ